MPALDQIGTPTTATWQLLDMITVEFTESGAKSRDVQITLDKYMEKRELKDRKEARKQVTKDLELLRVSAINFTEPRKKGEPQGYYKLNISSGAGISKSGVITFSFSDKFYNLLMGYPVMPYPPQLYALNNKRNPNSFYFLRKIAEHKNMNVGKASEDIISVKTLLAASLFLFRTVLGAAALLAFASAALLTNASNMKKGWRRLAIIGWGIITLATFSGGTIATEVEGYWEDRNENVVYMNLFL